MTVTHAGEAVRRYATEVRQALSDIPDAEVAAEIGYDVSYEAMVERVG